VFVFAFALIGRSLAVWTENVYTAYEVNRYSFRQISIFRTLEVVLGLLVLIVWQEALPLVLIHGLAWCLEAVYGLFMIHRRVFPLRLEINFAKLSRIFLQGVPLGVVMILMARKLDFQALFCASLGAVLFSLTISELVLRFGAFGAICSAGIGMMMTTTGLILVLRNRRAMNLRASLIRPGLTVLAAVVVYYALHAFGPALSLLGAFFTLALGGYLFKCLTPQDMIWLRHSLGSFTHKKSSD